MSSVIIVITPCRWKLALAIIISHYKKSLSLVIVIKNSYWVPLLVISVIITSHCHKDFSLTIVISRCH